MAEITRLSGYTDIYDPYVQQELYKYLTDNIEKIANGNRKVVEDLSETIISIHNERNTIMKGLWNRYRQKKASKFEWDEPIKADGIPIFAREPVNSTKVNNRIHTPFDVRITTNKTGYLTGTSPKIAYNIDNEQRKEIVREIITNEWNRADMSNRISELCQSATDRGIGILMLSSPKGKDDIYYVQLRDWEAVVIYNPITGEPEFAFRYYVNIVDANDYDNNVDSKSLSHNVEIYDKTFMYRYNDSGAGYVSEEPVEHLFEGVPIVEFPNNTDRQGDVELTITEQDAFDLADSDLSSEISQLRLAYLFFENLGMDIDDDFMKKLKQTGAISSDENGDAKFIEKNINASAVENLKLDLKQRIYEFSNSYDPNSLGSDRTQTAYQIKQKLFPLDQSCNETEKQFKKSLKEVNKLIASFYDNSKSQSISEEEIDSIDIMFNRQVPRNSLQDLIDSRNAGYNISQENMSKIVPFEINQEKNEQQLKEEHESTMIELTPSE